MGMENGLMDSYSILNQQPPGTVTYVQCHLHHRTAEYQFTSTPCGFGVELPNARTQKHAFETIYTMESLNEIQTQPTSFNINI